jgi:hypothetical protein
MRDLRATVIFIWALLATISLTLSPTRAYENFTAEMRACDETAAREIQSQGPYCDRDRPVGAINALINLFGACRDRIERARQQCYRNAPEVHQLLQIYVQNRCDPDVVQRIMMLQNPDSNPTAIMQTVRSRLELNGCIAP